MFDTMASSSTEQKYEVPAINIRIPKLEEQKWHSYKGALEVVLKELTATTPKEGIIARDEKPNDIKAYTYTSDVQAFLTENGTKDKHYYELLKGRPLRPYVDVEWDEAQLPVKETLTYVHSLVSLMLESRGITVKSTAIFCASGECAKMSSGRKASFHMIFDTDKLFDNTASLKNLMVRLLAIASKHSKEYAGMLWEKSNEEKKETAIDMSVYKPNQIMRLPYQTKFSCPTRPLIPYELEGVGLINNDKTTICVYDEVTNTNILKWEDEPEPEPETAFIDGKVERVTGETGDVSYKIIPFNRTCTVKAEHIHADDAHSCYFIKKGKTRWVGTASCFSHKSRKLTLDETKEIVKKFGLKVEDEKNEEEDDDEESEEYNKMKADFELKYFYLRNIDKIAFEEANGKLLFFKTDKVDFCFAHFHIPGKKSFIMRWLKDPNKRQYLKLVNRINGEVGKDEYNIFKGLEGEKAKGEDKEGLERFKYLCYLMGSANQKYADYIINWFALLIQKPWEIPRTCIVFIGEQGVGKETIVDFVGNKLVGPTMFANISNPNEIFGPHASAMNGSLLQKIEEADGTINAQNAGRLKGLITRKTDKINPKGVGQYDLDVYPHVIMTTNNGNPVKIEQSDRRYVPFYMNAERLGDIQFWNKTYELFDKEGTVASVMKFLKEKNLKDFTASNIPANDFKEGLKEAGECPVHKFLVWWKKVKEYEELQTKDLYQKYSEWALDEKLETLERRMSFQTFSKKLPMYCQQGMMYTRIRDGYRMYRNHQEPQVEQV